jgi:malate dehydrogenase
MVPIINYCRIYGESLDKHVQSNTITQELVEGLIQRTRQGGGEIVQLLQTGSAFYAPAVSAFAMIQSIAKDLKRLLPVAAYVTSEYKIPKPLYLGVPAILGANGVEKIMSYSLTQDQQDDLDKSSASVCVLIEDLKRLGLI